MAPPNPCPGLLVIRTAETAELLLQKENLTELDRCNKKNLSESRGSIKCYCLHKIKC